MWSSVWCTSLDIRSHNFHKSILWSDLMILEINGWVNWRNWAYCESINRLLDGKGLKDFWDVSFMGWNFQRLTYRTCYLCYYIYLEVLEDLLFELVKVLNFKKGLLKQRWYGHRMLRHTFALWNHVKIKLIYI